MQVTVKGWEYTLLFQVSCWQIGRICRFRLQVVTCTPHTPQVYTDTWYCRDDAHAEVCEIRSIRVLQVWLCQTGCRLWHLDLGSIKVWQAWHCQTAFRLCPLESHLIWTPQMWHCQEVFFFQARHCQPICRLWSWEIRSIRVLQLRHCKQPADGDFWTFVQRELGILVDSVQSASNLLARHLYRISCFKSRLMGASPLSNTEACKKKNSQVIVEPQQMRWWTPCLLPGNMHVLLMLVGPTSVWLRVQLPCPSKSSVSNDVSKDLRHKMCA